MTYTVVHILFANLDAEIIGISKDNYYLLNIAPFHHLKKKQLLLLIKYSPFSSF